MICRVMDIIIKILLNPIRENVKSTIINIHFEFTVCNSKNLFIANLFQ